MKNPASDSITSFASGRQAQQNSQQDDNYDRLDGHGQSGKTVHVIEWDGNLEVHVYPSGSLKGLGLKLDTQNKNKPVMVLAYRFDTTGPKPIIRRNVLGIELRENFKVYKDPSPADYDKIVITNHLLNKKSSQVADFKLDPAPTQLYPDGHPTLVAKTPDEPARAPASSESIRPFSW